MPDTPLLRIGAVSQATGVGISTLRSWEARYGLPVPERTAGGHRLYPMLAVAQVRRVLDLVAGGASTAAAAASVLGAAPSPVEPGPAAAMVPLAELLQRTRAARAESHRLRGQLATVTAAARANTDRLQVTAAAAGTAS